MSTETEEGGTETVVKPEVVKPEVEAVKPEATKQEDNRIPLHRFNEVNEAKKEAVALREAAEAKAAEAAEALEKLRAEYEETTTKSQSALQRAQREGQTFRAGVVDDDHVDTVLYKYSKVQADADGNKPAYGEWLAEYVAKNPYLRGATRAPVDNGNGGAKKPTAKSAVSSEAIAAMTAAEYAAFRKHKG